MLCKISKYALIALVGLGAQSAFGWYDCKYVAVIKNNPPQDSSGGKINQIKASINPQLNDLAWYANFGKNSKGEQTNGFWLVLSKGPNPKGLPGQLAIFYLDASKAQPVLSVYGYNGKNGDSSYWDGNGSGGAADKILSSKNSTNWIKELVVKDNPDGTRTLGFRINPTTINNHSPLYKAGNPWEGAQIGDFMGVWFHPVTGLTTDYGTDGFLKKNKFSYANQGWYDDSWVKTTCSDNPVPEPATIGALAAGFVAILGARKLRK